MRARIYRADDLEAQPIQVFYREDPRRPHRGRYILAADELSHPKTQSYVHDSIVTIQYRRKTHTFRVFYKRHKLLPINRALQGLEMEGDILVVACGKKVGVRNMRGKVEERAAEQAVRRQAIRQSFAF